MVVLIDQLTGERLKVGEGDSLGDWTLSHIENQRLVFEQTSGKRVELKR